MTSSTDLSWLDVTHAAAVPASSAGRLASQIREHVLAMADGEFLGSKEDLLARYGVNVPTLRQAMVALMNEQLVTSRRGVGGGFFVRRPDAAVVTHIVALYLRSRAVALSEQVATLLPVRVEIARRAARSHNAAIAAELVRFLDAENNASLTVSFTAFNAAERHFHRLLAKLSGSTTLTLFLEILFSLSGLMFGEGDVFRNHMNRRVKYRTTRNRLAKAVLRHDEPAAMHYAEQCSRLTWLWLCEARPELVDADTHHDISRSRVFAPAPALIAAHSVSGSIDDEEDIEMPTNETSAIAALRKLEERQRHLEDRRDVLEQAAAVELGRAVMNSGGLSLGTERIGHLIEQAVALGIDEALRRLTVKRRD